MKSDRVAVHLSIMNYKEKLIKKYMFMSNVYSLEFLLKATYMKNLIKLGDMKYLSLVYLYIFYTNY